MREFEGKVAVITGAASGIGRALARLCASEGMRVVMADVATQGLDELAAELSRAGAHGLAMQCDVSRGADVAQLAIVTYERFGATHLLVNNAGVAGASGPSWAIPERDWAWTLGANLWGVIHAIREFVPRMLAQDGEAHIVNTASVTGLLPVAGAAPYSVSKLGLVALSESLALELREAEARIGVTVVCPAAVATGIVDSLRVREGDQIQDAIQEAIAAGMAPEEVARATIQAVRDGRFAVFTHEETVAMARAHFSRLLDGELADALPVQEPSR